MVEKKGIRKEVVNKTNEDFDDGMKQAWVGIKGTPGTGQTSKRGRHGNSYIKSTAR